MSIPVITHRFSWAENLPAKSLGWPVMLLIFIMASLQFNTMSNTSHTVLQLIAVYAFQVKLLLLFLPAVICDVFCGSDTFGFYYLNRGPDWSRASLWYTTAAISLVVWILITKTFTMDMLYWVIGITILLEVPSSIFHLFSHFKVEQIKKSLTRSKS